ncbi:MAG: hypothetical protein ABI389_14970 [Rhodanobacter sp.]
MVNPPRLDVGRQARVSMMAVPKVALEGHAGKIIKQELGKDSGGSDLRYSFEIKSVMVTHEVAVEAATAGCWKIRWQAPTTINRGPSVIHAGPGYRHNPPLSSR